MPYVIAGAIVGAFIGVIAYFAKKGETDRQNWVENLTEDQKNRLQATEVKFVEGKKNEWTQEGMICNMVEKGNKFACKVLWYNKVIPNNLYEQIQDGDLAVSKEEKENHNLKVGDFVKVYIAPEKTVGSFKIIFD